MGIWLESQLVILYVARLPGYVVTNLALSK